MKLALVIAALAIVPSIAHAETHEGAPPRWRGGVLVDAPLRSALRAKTPESRRDANEESNVLLYAMAVAPSFSAGANAAALHGSWQDAASLVLVSGETFAVTTGLVSLVKALTKRERPYASADGLASRCIEHPSDPECKGDRNASFFSGHSATAFAGAGLLCLEQIELGPGWAGIGCGAALSVAAATALLRIVADKHYATDTLVGALVGLASGVVLPYVMHFASFAPFPVARDLQARAAAGDRPAVPPQRAFEIAPWGAPGGEGISFTVPF